MDYYRKGEEKFGFVGSHLYAFFGGIFLKRLYRCVYDDVIKSHPHSVLDIGCGDGHVLRMLAHGLKNSRICGLDPSSEMLKMASSAAAKNGQSKSVEFRLGSSRQITFDGKFDFIFSSLSFHHWKDREKDIPYILKRVSKAGSFTIYEYNKESMWGLFRILSRHSISPSDFKHLDFEGFRKSIEIRGKFIIIKFKRK